jgi:VanZ family protein
MLYLIALFVLAGLLLFAPMPITPTYFARTIENAGHTPLFFTLTLGVFYALREGGRLSRPWLYVTAGIIGVGTGLASEVIQMPLARDASWEDVGADAVGAVLALAAFALFDSRADSRRWVRGVALLVACACIAMYVTPIVRMARAYMHRNGQFPVLADFRSRLEIYWIVGIGVKREITDGALHVELVADTFPGVAFHEPVPDWRGYKNLVIDVQNPDGIELNLGVRVHDRLHRNAFSDRFNKHYPIAPGERRSVTIPLEEVLHGPRNRLMDMEHISDVTLFRVGRPGSRKLWIYSLKLE